MDINEIRTRTISMTDSICDMLELVQQGFMEHKPEFLTSAMQKEHEVNDAEKLLTKTIFEMPKKTSQKKELAILQQMIETFERMGDEVCNMIERIEIKIAEKLLFSEEGVGQFNETYDAMKKSVEMMREFLKTKNAALKERVIDNGFHVKELVERYRKEHMERLVNGIGTPMGASMYFDMLDFTGNLARHASNIVKLF